MKTIVVDGWYGIPNIGDEAILASVTELAKSLTSDVEVIAASNDPVHTQRNHDVDVAIPRFRQRRPNIEWIRQIYYADEFWIGGGGLFSSPNLLHYCQMIATAKALGTRIVVVGVGASGFPPDDPDSDLLVKALNNVNMIITRNEDSATALSSSGVDTSIYPLSDLVFRFRDFPASDAADHVNVTDESIIVSVRDPPSERKIDIDGLATALDRAKQKRSIDYLFLPFNNQSTIPDSEVAKTVVEAMDTEATVVESEIDFTQAYNIINNSGMVVGMRLHSLIFAAHARTPFVGVAYRPKCESLLESLDKTTWWCDQIDSSPLAKEIVESKDNGMDAETLVSIGKLEGKSEIIRYLITESDKNTKTSSIYYPVLSRTVTDLAEGLQNKIRRGFPLE